MPDKFAALFAFTLLSACLVPAGVAKARPMTTLRVADVDWTHSKDRGSAACVEVTIDLEDLMTILTPSLFGTVLLDRTIFDRPESRVDSNCSANTDR